MRREHSFNRCHLSFTDDESDTLSRELVDGLVRYAALLGLRSKR